MRKLADEHKVYYAGPAPLLDIVADIAEHLEDEENEEAVESVSFERYFNEDNELLWAATVVTYGELEE